MKPKLTRVASVAIGIGFMTAACGSSGTPALSPAPSHSVAVGSPAKAPAGTFGTACAEIPANGMGSFSGMAQAPVATAAANSPLLSDLGRAVQAAGLAATLNSAKAITVFAPDNKAFAALGSGNVNTLMASKSDLKKVLEYHIVNGRITPADLASGAPLTSLLGTAIHPQKTGDGYAINNAEVVCGNIQTANATVYIVDKLLIP